MRITSFVGNQDAFKARSDRRAAFYDRHIKPSVDALAYYAGVYQQKHKEPHCAKHGFAALWGNPANQYCVPGAMQARVSAADVVCLYCDCKGREHS